MTAAELIKTLHERGVRLRADGERLVVDAPTGAITQELGAEIRSKKLDLLELLEAATRTDVADREVARLDRAGHLPLGLTQQRLWYLECLAPEAGVYNLPAAFRLEGELDLGVLRRALEEIFARHEVLRTQIGVADGEPYQEILASVDVPFELVDLSDRSADEAWTELHRRVDVLKDAPMDIARAPLAQCEIFRLAERDHVLFFMPHHLIWDAWSFDLFFDELDLLYSAFVEGKTSPLPELPYQYADYAAWHRDWAESREVEKHLRFWQRQLAGGLPILELPTDRSRPPVMSFTGARAVLEPDPALMPALSELAAQEDATPFMVLLAGFYALLHRHTGQSDLVVGSPVQARMTPGSDDLMGVFVNTLVLRAQLHDAMTFRDLLRNVRNTCVATYDHQDTPFDLLVEEFETERTLSRTPLYQALFSYQDVTNRHDRIGPLSRKSIYTETGVASTDVTMWLMNDGHVLEGGIDYADELFDADTMERMLGHYLELLRGAAANPDVLIRSMPMIPQAQREDQLARSAGRAMEIADVGVHQLIEQHAAATPDAIALEFQQVEMTYRELEEQTNRVAHRLRAEGVGVGDLVGVHLERSIEMIVALIGVWRAGAAYVPMDPEFPAERLRHMIEDSGLSVVISEAEVVDELPEHSATVVELDLAKPDWQNVPATRLDSAPCGDRDAYVMYTSGSTGKPKGVRVGHRSVVSLLASMAELTGFGPDDSLLAVTTLSFDISVLEFFLALTVGGRVVVGDRDAVSDGRDLLEVLEAKKPTVMQATPATWRMLRDAGWGGDAELTALCGGEELTLELGQWLAPRCRALFNVYGPTETTIWSSAQRIEPGDERIPIGRPLANERMHVLGPHRELLPYGVVGELYIAGDGLARGYWNRPDLTDERFVRDPFGDANARMYRTGDLARQRSDGVFEYCGRIDNQVQLRGHRIELGEIEANLIALSAIKEAVAVVRTVSEGDARLVAYIVSEPGVDMTTSELRRALASRLPRYMVPGLFVELDEMPLTPNGKIDRGSLPDTLGVDAADRGYVPPETEREKFLANVWQELIGAEQVGRHDNFFELGGHSLLSMRVVAAVENELGHRLDPRLMFFQTLEQIAAGISA